MLEKLGGGAGRRSNGKYRMDLSKHVEAFALPFVEAKTTVGLAVGVVYEGQNHAYCYGSLEKDGPAAPDERTLFEIGSITKVFTTTLLADMHLSPSCAVGSSDRCF